MAPRPPRYTYKYTVNATCALLQVVFWRLLDRRVAGWPRLADSVRSPPMSGFMSHYLVPAAIIAVAIVLVLGLFNMMRGGSPNTSQKLMRLRVLLQFVAIIVIMATIWVMHR